MKKTVFVLLSIVLLLITSCSSTKLTPEQIEAMATAAPPMVTEPEKVYVPVETIRYVFPEANIAIDEKIDATPEQLVAGNLPENIETIKSPTDFSNSIVEYDFIDGKIYKIFASPSTVTDLRLAPGEMITGDAAIGDSIQWQFSATQSTENGKPVQHLFIKPTVAGLSTTMIIPTNYRTYYLNLESYDSLFMTGVRWRYPQQITFKVNGEAGMDTESPMNMSEGLVDAANINLNYKISGPNIVWKPVAVYDDGVRTYFQMDPRFNTSAGAPSLYLLPTKSSSKKNLEVINYRVKGNLYIADFVLTGKQAFMLMAFTDDKKSEEVIITRN